MLFHIEYAEEARDSIRKLPGNYRQRIRRLIESLAENPHPTNALELRDLPGRYRIRIDNWRVIYRVDDTEILVLIIDIRLKTGPETYSNIN